MRTPDALTAAPVTSPTPILVLAHEFPPVAGSGVQRIAKLCKYLPESGFVPHVVSTLPAAGQPLDHSLQADVTGVGVVRLPSRNPSVAIARVLRPLKTVRRGARRRPALEEPDIPDANPVSPPSRVPLSIRLARWVTMDDASLWSRVASRAGVRLGRATGARVVIASGPPFSVLVAGARTADALGLPFIADMRDAWTANPGASTGRRAAVERRLLETVMRRADAVLCVSEPIAVEARRAGARRVEVIPNGFDAEEIPRWEPVPDGVVRVTFMGRYYGLTDPEPFLRGLATLDPRGPGSFARGAGDVRFDSIGPPNERFETLVRALGIADRVTSHGFLPHDAALTQVSHADVGLVSLADVPGADAVYTGKLFEYLGMGLPVLVVGPADGAAARLVREACAGWVIPPGDSEAIGELLASLAVQKLVEGRIRISPRREVVDSFERRTQTRFYADVISQALAHR